MGVTNKKSRNSFKRGDTDRYSVETSSRYGTPFKTDARGSHEMAIARIENENAHQNGYTKSGTIVS
jgi:hypothetical protein